MATSHMLPVIFLTMGGAFLVSGNATEVAEANFSAIQRMERWFSKLALHRPGRKVGTSLIRGKMPQCKILGKNFSVIDFFGR
ncbi:hypothetical protein J2Z82_000088 [Virgibacillus litoralis]|uniref:Uncharacterized protein n=1 Tax=Virgibacillus litoralis TaxID=578221 RepID=A0ABS4H8C5_9BACI|nr:hypothetical protein [Virgibacillus litoralis]